MQLLKLSFKLGESLAMNNKLLNIYKCFILLSTNYVQHPFVTGEHEESNPIFPDSVIVSSCLIRFSLFSYSIHFTIL